MQHHKTHLKINSVRIVITRQTMEMDIPMYEMKVSASSNAGSEGAQSSCLKHTSYNHLKLRIIVCMHTAYICKLTDHKESEIGEMVAFTSYNSILICTIASTTKCAPVSKSEIPRYTHFRIWPHELFSECTCALHYHGQNVV